VSSLARLDVTHHAEHPVVSIEGEIDASNAMEIGDAVRAVLSNRTSALVIDLTPASYLDSAGINLLFQLGTELRDRQQRLHVVAPAGSAVARMLDISGLSTAGLTHPTREEALARATAR
jgi:anti-anti-sigma factor